MRKKSLWAGLLCMAMLLVMLVPVQGMTTEIFNWNFDTQENVDAFKSIQQVDTYSKRIGVTLDETALKVVQNSTDQGRNYLTSSTWQEGSTYTISFKAKGDGVNLSFGSAEKINILYNGVEKSSWFSVGYPLTSDWQTYSVTFTMLQSSSSQMFFYLKTPAVDATYWLDDLSLTEEKCLYDSLDLSGTEKTILASGETTQISVKGIKGETVTEVTEGVTFSSSNSQVASVNESGLVTAGREGTAVITATADEVSKSVTIVVGQVQKTIDYENSTDWTDTETEKVVADQVRSGAKALWMNTLNSTTALSASVALSKGGGMKEITTLSQGAVQLWFYDDMETGKNVFFQVTGVRNETTNKRMNSYIGINTTTNTYAEVGGETFSDDMVKSTVPRSLGWHQLVVSWDSEKIYFTIDGQEVVSGTKPVDTPVASINFFKKASCPEQDFWVDDLISVNTVPVVSHNVTVTVGENGTVSYGGSVVTNGQQISVLDGGDLTLDLTPASGYQAKAAVDGVDYAINNNQITLTGISQDTEVSVTFEKIVQAPSIDGSSADYIMTDPDYEKGYSFVSYYKITVPAGYTLNECGMYFIPKEETADPLKLQAKSDLTSNTFGIRVFGPAVSADQTYTFRGYALVSSEGEAAQEITTDIAEK
ncbi:MAG: Ig-like domain-containing protein [Clostridia bacterium]|nr:Ig-like domain-containing protein [Clostridia bacterium]